MKKIIQTTVLLHYVTVIAMPQPCPANVKPCTVGNYSFEHQESVLKYHNALNKIIYLVNAVDFVEVYSNKGKLATKASKINEFKLNGHSIGQYF